MLLGVLFCQTDDGWNEEQIAQQLIIDWLFLNQIAGGLLSLSDGGASSLSSRGRHTRRWWCPLSSTPPQSLINILNRPWKPNLVDLSAVGQTLSCRQGGRWNEEQIVQQLVIFFDRLFFNQIVRGLLSLSDGGASSLSRASHTVVVVSTFFYPPPDHYHH